MHKNNIIYNCAEIHVYHTLFTYLLSWKGYTMTYGLHKVVPKNKPRPHTAQKALQRQLTSYKQKQFLHAWKLCRGFKFGNLTNQLDKCQSKIPSTLLNVHNPSIFCQKKIHQIKNDANNPVEPKHKNFDSPVFFFTYVV